jgi:type IV secretory pathway TraG/TraD family ATPase VirD4
MTPTKLLIGQILIVFAIMIAGVWAATQWCAAMLGYQVQLGPAWFRLLGTPIYRPWSIFPWWYHYDAYAPHIFDKAGTVAGASGFLGCAMARAPIAQCHHLWFGALGQTQGNRAGRASRGCRCVPRASARTISSS